MAGLAVWLLWYRDGGSLADPASSETWRPLDPDTAYSSDRGFVITGPDQWFIIEPDRPQDSALVAVLSTAEAEWQNGADQQLPIIYILHHIVSDGPQAVALWYPRYAWTPVDIDGVDSLKTGWEPDASSTWGGRIWLIPSGRDVWELRVFVPEGQRYESTQEDVGYILDSFSLEASR